MNIEKLSDELPLLLMEAEEIWIAAALVTDEGFNFIQENIPSGTVQHFLVGIDMLTPVTVLNTMLSMLEKSVLRHQSISRMKGFSTRKYM